MTSVKGDEPAYPVTHLAAQMGRLHNAMRQILMAQEWDGLRQSHLRLLSEVPPEGITISELGERLAMTKQASGQFVTHLVESGHLRVRLDPADRRSRIVSRTEAGDAVTRAATARIERLEQDWAALVGVRRYAQFRRVLDDLVAAND